MNHKAKAIELLGERQEYNTSDGYYEKNEKDCSNQMHSKAVGVVVRLLEKYEELEKKFEALAEGHADLNDRLNEVGKENETLRQKYQELNEN